MTTLQPSSAEKTICKTHIAQPILGRPQAPRHLAEILRSRCGTLLTSPPLQASTYQEPPQLVRNKHAFSFHSPVMQPMSFASRKRLQPNPASVRPKKVPRVSRKRSYRLAKSSPGAQGYPTAFMAPVLIPETPSVVHQLSDEETDSELPLPNRQNASSTIGSSPPLISPESTHDWHERAGMLKKRIRQTRHRMWSTPPTPAHIIGSNQVFPPSSPPSQHAILPSKTRILDGAMFGTLGNSSPQFNFADFVHLTSSPTQAAWDTRTHGNPLRTPTTTKET
ncbi:uncharacterized protein N7506_000149 [Penicillium brevicompactum]|uniref:uncharacterized protein n=1 Tax=Penicillium brevicompactum TaxID=5074 RepID=UPI00253F899F|nr:uncharacterized protein N7506_000149 [Penicillium brevicompactum]KAJ5346896.1 hypothetical protein N7506_000149 [Penicillium brevicompactum]